MLWRSHLRDKDTTVLAADQRIYATVLHLDRRFDALTNNTRRCEFERALNHGAELPESNPFL